MEVGDEKYVVIIAKGFTSDSYVSYDWIVLRWACWAGGKSVGGPITIPSSMIFAFSEGSENVTFFWGLRCCGRVVETLMEM